MSGALAHLSPDTFEQRGRLVLIVLYTAAVALVMLTTAYAPRWLPFVPALLLGAAGAALLLMRPTWNLFAVIVGFFIISGYSPETTPEEILYSLYALGYLAGWFLLRWLVFHERVVKTWDDALLMGLLLYATFSLVHNRVLGGELSLFLNEWASFILLAFYFPVKHHVATHPRGATHILTALLLLATLMAVRNLYVIVQDFHQVTQLWQYLLLREVINPQFFVFSSLASLILWLHARTPLARWALLLLFTLHFAALLGTQTRSMWFDFALGAGLLFLLSPASHRLRLLTAALSGMAGFLLLGWALFGQTFWLVLAGLVNRLFSIREAFTRDLSLINRYRETDLILKLVQKNPVAGYGLGVPHRFFDRVHEVTLVKTWIHNGFVAVWYKFGLPGFLALFGFWGHKIWQGFRLWRTRLRHPRVLIPWLSLIALIPSTYSQNPFHSADSIFLFAILTGWLSGLYVRNAS